MAEYLSISEVAALAGVTPATLRSYLARTPARRARGLPPLVPDPDVRLGQSPGWEPETVQAWLECRPGKGAGAGRKPRRSAAG